jgi:hypothetical protein
MQPAQFLASRHHLGLVVLLVVAGGLTIGARLPVAGLVVVVAGFGMLGYGLASAIVPARTWLDRLLATVTFGMAGLAVVAEGLSLATLLGSVTAWTIGAVLYGAVGGLLPGRPLRRLPGPKRMMSSLPRWQAGLSSVSQIGRAAVWVLLLGAGVHLATVFLLSWFAGIVVGDSITHYLPRSIRFLQNGTFGIFQTYYDFMQYLHQTVVAVQFLFLRSDVLVNPTSFVSVSLMSVAVFALARSLGWPSPYPVFAALAPLSMPIVLLHATTGSGGGRWPRAIGSAARSIPTNVASGATSAIGMRLPPSPPPSSRTRHRPTGAGCIPKSAAITARRSGWVCQNG